MGDTGRIDGEPIDIRDFENYVGLAIRNTVEGGEEGYEFAFVAPQYAEREHTVALIAAMMANFDNIRDLMADAAEMAYEMIDEDIELSLMDDLNLDELGIEFQNDKEDGQED